jgi:quercetin dioxygenase-like cupin family protein
LPAVPSKRVSGDFLQQDVLETRQTREDDKMNLRYAVLGGLMSLAMAVPASAGDVTVVEWGANKIPMFIKKDPYKMVDFPKFDENRPNKGFSYTTAFELPGTGLQAARWHVDANGTIAIHDGKQQYILYVISGTGKMTLHDSLNGKVVAETSYKPDDIIVFQTNPPHAWQNGDQPLEFFGIDVPPHRP